MAITLEQVEKLREKANVSYEEAKIALEQNHGDLLEALITLEREGKTNTAKGGFVSTQPGAEQNTRHTPPPPPPSGGHSKARADGHPGFWGQLQELCRAGVDILRNVSVNQFEVWRNGQVMTSVPVLILVVLVIVAFWITIPLIIIGLFFGCRYRFSGPNLGKNKINNAMGAVSDTVDDIVEQVQREFNKNKK